MKIKAITALVLLGISFCPAQNTRVSWGAFTMGYSKLQAENTTVHAVSGQSFVGLARESNVMITSGFLADTSFQKVLVAIGRQEEGVPGAYELAQNYPNPFNPSTTIHFEIPVRSQVTLKVYNLLGQEVRTLMNNEEKGVGRYYVRFDAEGLASGAYFYRLVAGDYVETKKLLLLR